MAAGDMTFRLDVQGADELMAKIRADQTQLVVDAKREALAAGRQMRQTARALSRSKMMPGLSRSIDTSTRQFAAGIEVTVEAKSPWGYIREFGAGRSGPHPFMAPAFEQHLPGLERALSDALERLL
jgi:HK97 gp10 family phage protein